MVTNQTIKPIDTPLPVRLLPPYVFSLTSIYRQVWDSYENYAKLQTNEAFLTLVDSMKTLASSAASVQNMRIDVEDVPRILSGPLVQLVTVKAREEHTGEDILKVTQKMQDAVPKGAAGGFFAVGQVEDDTQTVMLLIPWKATVEVRDYVLAGYYAVLTSGTRAGC